MASRTGSFLSFDGLDIADLIGAPVIAISKANTMMAREQLKLLIETCFKKTKRGYEPRMITMNIYKGFIPPNESEQEPSRQDLDLLQVKATFLVPVITLLPIGSLAIQSSEVDMKLEITEQRNNPIFKEGEPQNSNENNPVLLMGKIGKNSKEETKSSGIQASIDISMDIGVLPLATGLTNILDHYSRAMDPLEVDLEDNNALTNTKSSNE